MTRNFSLVLVLAMVAGSGCTSNLKVLTNGNATTAKEEQNSSGPDVTSDPPPGIVGLNGPAEDGIINATEELSDEPLVVVSAPDSLEILYSQPMEAAVAETCDSGKNYELNESPRIRDLSDDGAYVVCIQVRYEGGKVAYLLSPAFERRAALPTVNAGSDIISNQPVTLTATISGATSYAWSLVTGPGIINFDTPNTIQTNATPSTDGQYTVKITAVDTYGNSSSDSLQFTFDTTPPQNLTLSSPPSAFSRNGALNTLVNGVDLQDYRYALVDGEQTSCPEVNFSAWIPATTPMTDNLGADGAKTLCILGRDALGNATTLPGFIYTWTLDTDAPPSTSLRGNVGPGMILNAWYDPEDEGKLFYLLVRGVSSVTWTPTPGVIPTPGNIDGTQSILYNGPFLSFSDTSITLNTAYEYVLYVRDAAGNYSFPSRLKLYYKPFATQTTHTAPQRSQSVYKGNFQGTAALLSPDGLTMALGSTHDYTDTSGGGTLRQAGAYYIYVRPNDSSAWSFQQKIVYEGLNMRTNSLGWGDLNRASLSNDTLAIGSPYDYFDENGNNPTINSSGAVYVYRRSGVTWSLEQKLAASGVNGRIGTGEKFGDIVVLDNDTLAVGSPSHWNDKNGDNPLSNAGAVWIFRRMGTVWNTETRLVAEGPNARQANGSFGSGLGLSGNRLVVGSGGDVTDETGATFAAGKKGAAYYFTRSGSTWSFQQKLHSFDSGTSNATERFGAGLICLGTDILLIPDDMNKFNAAGGDSRNGAGAIYSYKWSGTSWTPEQKIVSPLTRADYDWFGRNMSLSGNRLAVSLIRHQTDAAGANPLIEAGAVVTMTYSSPNWSLEQKIVPTSANGRSANDVFGTGIALVSNSLIASAPKYNFDDTGTNVMPGLGTTFTFTRGASWTQTSQNSYQVNRVIPDESMRFGKSIAMSPDGLTLVVGAPYDTTDENGANTMQAVDLNGYTLGPGAVYIYTRTSTVGAWNLQKKLAAPGVNGRSIYNNAFWRSDLFGHSLSLNDDTLVVGAPYHRFDSNGNNLITWGAGKVYIFVRSGTDWSLQQEIDGSLGIAVNGRLQSDTFGDSVALSGNTLGVGATCHNFDADGLNPVGCGGAVFIYTRNAGNWSYQQKLVGVGTNSRGSNDYFGRSLALVQDTIAVGTSAHKFDAAGANSKSEAGAVFVFTRSGSTWNLEQKLVANPSRSTNDKFGTDVSLGTDMIAIGGSKSNNYSGAVWVFTRTGTSWTFDAKLTDGGINSSRRQVGGNVLLAGNTLMVSALDDREDIWGNEQNEFLRRGSILLYHREGGFWFQGTRLKINEIPTGQGFNSFSGTIPIATNGTNVVAGFEEYGWNAARTLGSQNTGGVFEFAP